jgi:hypothetical protein
MELTLEITIANARSQQPVGSPCTGVCRLHRQTGYCEGCMRSRDEIKGWKTMGDGDKLMLFDRLIERSNHANDDRA